jgi:Fic family protein
MQEQKCHIGEFSLQRPKITNDQYAEFVEFNNKLDSIQTTTEAIKRAIEAPPTPDPYIHGPLAVINYMQQYISDKAFATCRQSDIDLKFVRDMHAKLLKPVHEATPNDPNTIKKFQLGVYRTKPSLQGYGFPPRAAPQHIRQLMVNWFIKLHQADKQFVTLWQRPLQVNQEHAANMSKTAYNLHLEFITIWPFSDANYGNTRLARFIDAMLRHKWGLPLRQLKNVDKDAYLNDQRKYKIPDYDPKMPPKPLKI